MHTGSPPARRPVLPASRLLVGALLALALVVAACGRGGEPSPSVAVAQETVQPEPSPSVAVAQETVRPEPSPSAAVAPETVRPEPRPERLTLVYWQAPSLPIPYLSGGDKDADAGAVTLEPLASYDPEGGLAPRLAAEIPTLENGGISEDLLTVTWRLREGLTWSDGSAMTAEDVVFTWRYCLDEAAGCTSRDVFHGIVSVEAPNDRTVRITFDGPTPYPYTAFVGASMPILSREQFADCVGAAARGCEAQNVAPVGTGAYRIVEFTPDSGAVYERNPFYRGEAAYFDEGGSAGAAAMRPGLRGPYWSWAMRSMGGTCRSRRSFWRGWRPAGLAGWPLRLRVRWSVWW